MFFYKWLYIYTPNLNLGQDTRANRTLYIYTSQWMSGIKKAAGWGVQMNTPEQFTCSVHVQFIQFTFIHSFIQFTFSSYFPPTAGWTLIVIPN